jgi:hypothetical protein
VRAFAFRQGRESRSRSPQNGEPALGRLFSHTSSMSRLMISVLIASSSMKGTRNPKNSLSPVFSTASVSVISNSTTRSPATTLIFFLVRARANPDGVSGSSVIIAWPRPLIRHVSTIFMLPNYKRSHAGPRAIDWDHNARSASDDAIVRQPMCWQSCHTFAHG